MSALTDFLGTTKRQQNFTGLDPNLITSTTDKGWGSLNGPTYKAPSTTYSYNGPGGTFTNQGGAWTSASGQRVGDLPGYLNMRQQQAEGANTAPYMSRLKDLITDPSSIQNDPAYQFRIDQGNQAINRSAAAKGMLGSGNVLAQLAKYGQGMASEEYGNQIDSYSGLLNNAQNFGLQTGYYDQGARSPFGLSNFKNY